MNRNVKGIEFISITISNKMAEAIGIEEGSTIQVGDKGKINILHFIQLLELSDELSIGYIKKEKLPIPFSDIYNTRINTFKIKDSGRLIVNIDTRVLSNGITKLIEMIEIYHNILKFGIVSISRKQILEFIMAVNISTFMDNGIKSISFKIGKPTFDMLGLDEHTFTNDIVEHSKFVTLIDYCTSLTLHRYSGTDFNILRKDAVITPGNDIEIQIDGYQLSDESRTYTNEVIDKCELIEENKAIISYPTIMGIDMKGRIMDTYKNVCGNRAKMHKELNKRNIGDDVDMKNIGIMSFEDFINVIQRAGANEYEADKSKIEVSKLDELVITGGLVKAGYTGEITLDVIQDVKFNARGINLDEYDYKRHILLMNDMDTPENILSEINSDKNVHRIIIKKDGLTYTNIEVTYNNENIVAYDFINNTRNEIKK